MSGFTTPPSSPQRNSPPPLPPRPRLSNQDRPLRPGMLPLQPPPPFNPVLLNEREVIVVTVEDVPPIGSASALAARANPTARIYLSNDYEGPGR